MFLMIDIRGTGLDSLTFANAAPDSPTDSSSAAGSRECCKASRLTSAVRSPAPARHGTYRVP